uniref:Uncharacterized protein n=1 Tax=Arcella intermedia TaxID=1963864 RepID=A0A6B2LLT5_9EUKA
MFIKNRVHILQLQLLQHSKISVYIPLLEVLHEGFPPLDQLSQSPLITLILMIGLHVLPQKLNPLGQNINLDRIRGSVRGVGLPLHNGHPLPEAEDLAWAGEGEGE